MKKVGFISLGCPKNLVDSEVMMGRLKQEGYELTSDAAEADTLVVTGAYNRVRFGAGGLTEAEAAEVESCLRRMEESSQ